MSGRPVPGFYADPSHLAVRLGLRSVRGLHDALLDRIDDERDGPPFTDLEDFVRRTGATVDQVEALATAGAFEHCFGQSRRSALWAAGALGTARRTCGATVRWSRRCRASSPAPMRRRCRA